MKLLRFFEFWSWIFFGQPWTWCSLCWRMISGIQLRWFGKCQKKLEGSGGTTPCILYLSQKKSSFCAVIPKLQVFWGSWTLKPENQLSLKTASSSPISGYFLKILWKLFIVFQKFMIEKILCLAASDFDSKHCRGMVYFCVLISPVWKNIENFKHSARGWYISSCMHLMMLENGRQLLHNIWWHDFPLPPWN